MAGGGALGLGGDDGHGSGQGQKKPQEAQSGAHELVRMQNVVPRWQQQRRWWPGNDGDDDPDFEMFGAFGNMFA